MNADVLKELDRLLETLGLDEEPMGVFFADEEPSEGFSPRETPGILPTKDKEDAGAIDWGTVFGNFSCTIGNIWRARKKKTVAYFSQDRFGCPGGAFWMGMLKPQTDMIVHYVSSGIPGQLEGERYIATPDEMRTIFEYVDPQPTPARFIVFKPLSLFAEGETPELVCFFTRPESLAGLHQLVAFITGRPDSVRSPFSAACGSLVAWPLHYRARHEDVAVLGGWDPSARKYFKTDELSFTVPWTMFQTMLARWPQSFLGTKNWKLVQKKIARSKKVWGEE